MIWGLYEEYMKVIWGRGYFAREWYKGGCGEGPVSVDTAETKSFLLKLFILIVIIIILFINITAMTMLSSTKTCASVSDCPNHYYFVLCHCVIILRYHQTKPAWMSQTVLIAGLSASVATTTLQVLLFFMLRQSKALCLIRWAHVKTSKSDISKVRICINIKVFK